MERVKGEKEMEWRGICKVRNVNNVSRAVEKMENEREMANKYMGVRKMEGIELEGGNWTKEEAKLKERNVRKWKKKGRSKYGKRVNERVKVGKRDATRKKFGESEEDSERREIRSAKYWGEGGH